MSIIKHVTLQKIVAHDFRYDPRNYETEENTNVCDPANAYLYPRQLNLLANLESGNAGKIPEEKSQVHGASNSFITSLTV